MPPYGKQIGFFKQKTLRPFFTDRVFFSPAPIPQAIRVAQFCGMCPLIVHYSTASTEASYTASRTTS